MYTERKWEVSSDLSEIRDEHGRTICEIACEESDEPLNEQAFCRPEEAKANGRLISAAPELLEACKVLTSYTTDLLYRLDDQVNLRDIEEVQQASQAIAKAERSE